MATVACGSRPPSGTQQLASAPAVAVAVAARWVADDGSVVAVNLVVPAGTGPQGIRELAERERGNHPGARVIVRIFSTTAGPERYVIGHVPGGTEPLPQVSPPPSSLLALYDFPAPP